MTRARALGLALSAGLALPFLIEARPLAAEPHAFRVPGEMPFPDWVKSAEVTRADEPLYQGPSNAEPRRGAAARGARLPVFGSKHGPGCRTRYLLVGALAWLCQDGAELSPAAPDTDDDGALPKSRDGLPYRYHFVGPDGTFGYRAVQTAEDGVPDAQLLKGFGVAVIRVEKNPEGNQFGLTTEDLWVPMRDLSPVAPIAFHGRELSGALSVAWVTSQTAFASAAPGKPQNPKLKLSRFQTLDVLEQRELAGHRWFRYAADAWLSDRDARAPTPADLPSELRPGERWIDVEIASQVLTAYVGDRPVFATLVSTGRGNDGSVLATPRGVHRLWVKLRGSNMDNLDDESAAENYAIQAVPWVMYFERGYGLHGTFWHRAFGSKHSHGCVNLTPLDAERLFGWTSPKLPPGWSAALPTSYEPGTLIRVR
ncbi:MAG TPA: L,D-transpeptidase [Polyangiaceae bacterium]|nr:L,D-transpeptidase [Polyangiaceae bacterium]